MAISQDSWLITSLSRDAPSPNPGAAGKTMGLDCCLQLSLVRLPASIWRATRQTSDLIQRGSSYVPNPSLLIFSLFPTIHLFSLQHPVLSPLCYAPPPPPNPRPQFYIFPALLHATGHSLHTTKLALFPCLVTSSFFIFLQNHPIIFSPTHPLVFAVYLSQYLF